MRSRIRARSSRTIAVLSAALTTHVGGCALMVSPFSDEFASEAAVTTPSVEGVAAAEAGSPSDLRRPYADMVARTEDGGVTHGPLYFEDPFEDKGSQDGCYKWTGEDYVYFLYSRARFLINGIFLPVSAIVTPPWTVMVSDGRLSPQALGLDHDAQRLSRMDGE